MTTHANIYPTFTIKDLAKAHGQRPQNRGSVCANACRHVHMGAWSSGMIRASGARGRGFDSRSSPSHVAHVAARAAGQPRDARTPNAGQAAARQVRRGHESRGGLPLLRLDDQGGRLEALLPGDVRRRRGRGPPPLVRRQVRRARRGPREGLHRARQHRPDGH